MTREERNTAVVASLHPELQGRALLLLAWSSANGMQLLFTEGRRTFTRQEALYAQGRTTDGPIVTSAQPGRSFHNFGLAIDLVDLAASGMKEKFEPADYEHTSYLLIAGKAAMMGMDWGGAWRRPDKPHLEWHPSFTRFEAAKLKNWSDHEGFLPLDFFASRGMDDVA